MRVFCDDRNYRSPKANTIETALMVSTYQSHNLALNSTNYPTNSSSTFPSSPPIKDPITFPKVFLSQDETVWLPSISLTIRLCSAIYKKGCKKTKSACKYNRKHIRNAKSTVMNVLLDHKNLYFQSRQSEIFLSTRLS
mmetsp:Transcript_10263/g.20654  ORF Transcript_10263/g.20654 Transcript_10263/m.20654 type:complete len:138 (+) Transcript_10263:152-565(+)